MRSKQKRILVTGGCGFIGSAAIRLLMSESEHKVMNIDKLTYASNKHALCSVEDDERYFFSKIDLCDQTSLQEVFNDFDPDYVLHLAAETHVDRSINSPKDFVNTNLLGTFNLLDISLAHCRKRKANKNFRFHHVSTDEVFGDLGPTDPAFTENSSYRPSSPYSATKAGSDHLVSAWGRTYRLPVIISNCSNNYGPYQHPEKLIPKAIINGLSRIEIPIFGDGTQIRDWLFVEDHARALLSIIEYGSPFQTYNIGGDSEVTNIKLVRKICDIFDEMNSDTLPHRSSHHDLIRFVTDRPGHDRRYAIDSTKIKKELGWRPIQNLETGIRLTVDWYQQNLDFFHVPVPPER